MLLQPIGRGRTCGRENLRKPKIIRSQSQKIPEPKPSMEPYKTLHHHQHSPENFLAKTFQRFSRQPSPAPGRRPAAHEWPGQSEHQRPGAPSKSFSLPGQDRATSFFLKKFPDRISVFLGRRQDPPTTPRPSARSQRRGRAITSHTRPPPRGCSHLRLDIDLYCFSHPPPRVKKSDLQHRPASTSCV